MNRYELAARMRKANAMAAVIRQLAARGVVGLDDIADANTPQRQAVTTLAGYWPPSEHSWNLAVGIARRLDTTSRRVVQ